MDTSAPDLLSLLCRINSNGLIHVNAAVDRLIESIIEMVIEYEVDEMSVPDVHEEWEEKKKFIRISGFLKCTDGRVRSLTSLQRTGDANVRLKDDSLVLRVVMGFGELELEYNKCQVVLHRLFSVATSLRASVQSNSIDAQISFGLNGGELRPSIDHIFLAEFGKIRIHTGGGPLSKIRDHLLEIVAKHFHSNIRELLNEKLELYAKKAISHVNLTTLLL